MTKIYSQGNYIVIEANNERNTFPKRDVRFKVVDEDGIYSLSSQELPIGDFNYSEVKKEDGSDYTTALEFETFLFENTGNFNSGADASPNVIGSIKITDTAPTVQGLYILSDVGTYANLGGLVATADKLNYAYFDGTTWKLIPTSSLGGSGGGSGLVLGETESTAYRGDRGKIAYDHSQVTGNPHNTTKSEIGLGNVDNTSDANKPISNATQTALDLKADLAYVNNIQIGGRNLIINSTNDDTILLYGATATRENIVDATLPSKNYFKFTNVVRTVGDYVFYIPTRNKPDKFSQSLIGKKIQISFYIRSNNSQKLFFERDGNQNFMIDSTWKKVSFNVIFDIGNLHFLLEGSGLTSFDISSVKIEFGDKATDWTPAPEDKQDRLQNVTGKIGVGKTDASATEKLDVNGNVKANGFKTPTGTATQALTANGGVFDLTTKADLTLVNNIQIGGRNLITKLSKEKSYPATTFWEYFPLSEKLKEGETYILNGTVENVGGFITIGLNNLNGVNNYLISLPINIPFVASNEMANRTHFSISNQTGVGTSIFKRFKLEKGNKSTDWTPAPEDKQDRLQDITGNTGVGKTDASATEKLDVNGNVKSNSYKFNLQASVTPTPNTLIPKTDGSGLIWYDNSSVENNIPFLPYNWVFGLGSGLISTNTAIGKDSLKSNSTGENNTSIGWNALIKNTTGNSNTAIGRSALSGNIGGYSNTSIGYLALSENSWGIRNTAVGNASQRFSTGNDNCSFGDSTLVNSGGAVSNSVFGSGSGYSCTGNLNSAFGHKTLGSCSGASNVAIGAWNANSIGSGNKCVFVGAVDFGFSSTANATNMIAIGFNVAGKGSNTVELGNDSISNTYLKGKVNLNNRLKLASYTKTQRDALTNKEVGDMIWQTDSGNSGIRVYDGTNWLAVQTIID